MLHHAKMIINFNRFSSTINLRTQVLFIEMVPCKHNSVLLGPLQVSVSLPQRLALSNKENIY
jgi:hypothetical protein